MQQSKDKNKSKAQFAGEVKKMRERIAELEESHKRSKNIEKIITIQRNLALELNKTHDLEKGLQLCLEAAIKVSGLDCGGVYLVDDTSGDFHLKFYVSLPPDFVKSVSCFNSKSANAKLVMTGKPAYTRHPELDVPLKKAELSESLRAIAIIPIKHKKKVIACLNVASHTLDEVPVYSRTSLETIAGQIGSSLAHLKAEEKIKESEKKFRTAIENSPDFIVFVKRDGSIFDVSRLEKGFTKEMVIGQSVFNENWYDTKNQAKNSRKQIEYVFRTGKLGRYEYSQITPDGSLSFYETKVAPFEYDTKGNVISAQCVTRDTSEKRKAEENYKELANSIDDIFFAFDKELRYTYWNKASEKLTGISAKDAIGKTIFDIFPDNEETRKSIEAYKKVLKNRRSKSFINEYNLGDKKYFFEINAYPSETGLSVFTKDITDRLEAEEALANERTYLKIMNEVSNVLNTNGSFNNVTDIILQGLDLHGANIGLVEKDNRLYVRGASTDLNKMFANAARSLFFDFNINATARKYFNSLNETKTLPVEELFNLISDKGSISSKIIKTLISELTKASVGETIIAPLTNSVGDRIGAVLLTKKPNQTFNKQEKALVDSLCGTLALAIDKNIGQQELGESEKRYRLLLESLSDSVYVLDREWRHVVVNEAAEKFVNIPKEKLIGGKLTDLFPGVEETPFFKVFKKVMKTRKSDIVTNEYEFEDGRKNWYEVRVYPVPEGILCISRDITEPKKSEMALNQKVVELNSFVNNIPDMAWLKDTKSNFIVANKAFGDAVGMDPHYLINNTCEACFGKEAAEKFKEDDKKVMKSTKQLVIEESITDAKKNKIWLETIKSPIIDKSGKVTGTVGIARNITDRKKTEEELKRERDRAQKYLDIADTMFIAINTEGVVTLINKKGCEMLGYEEDEIVGKNWFENFVPERIKEEILPVSHKLLTGEIEASEFYENPILTRNREERLIAWHNTVIRDERSKIIGHLSSGEDITERKRAEEELIKSRKDYEDLYDNAPDMFFSVDAKTAKIIKCNQTSAGVLGYTKEEMLGKSAFDLYAPESAEYVKKKIFPLFQNTGQIKNKELQAQRKDGSVLEVSLNASAVYDSNGKIVHSRSSWRDITETKQAERLIKENQDRLNAIFENVQTGIFIIDEETHRIYDVNPAAVEMIDLPKEKIVGQECYRFICPAEEAKCPISDLGQTFDNSERMLVCGKKGKEVPILKTAAPMILDGHKYLVESFVDLSEKKRAEEQLVASEEKYRVIFENANDVIAQLDPLGKIINVNKKMEDMFGYKPEELIGKHFTKLSIVKLSELPKVLNIFKNMVISKKVSSLMELELLNKNGNEIVIEVSTERIDKNGKPDHFLCLIRDITERKRAQKEKEELESQLHQVEKMDAIGQLAGGIAHDFNNQLGSILGFADLIREVVMDDEKLSRYADNILITAKRSADITKQLLAFARKGKYKSVRVDIHKTIYEVISLLKHSIQKKIVIKQHLHDSPSTVMGDPSQLQNAILNIAINARDAMPKGGELIFATDTVFLDEERCKSLQYKIPQSNYLQICITDTGSGMDEETKQHIFEPFFTTKKIGEGTGMGLAAVYGTIKSHKGVIDVYSEVGHGTTFKIYLPFKSEGVEEDMDFFKQKDIVKGSAHILLADDEEMLCEMAKDMIETLGYKITVCRNGKEAIKVYKKLWKDIDLVILDMIMPEMDGKDAYLEMKKINPDIKVLLSSGYSMTGQARELLSRGVDDFIQKPYRKAELSQKIAKVLGNSE